MKSKFLKYLIACCVLFSSCHNDIWEAINSLDSRVSYLEELCKEMNTNITALQTIVSVIQSNDQIVSIAPVTKDGKEIGYVITFTHHEPITIYNGTDGKDGENGTNGKDGKDGNDGFTPVIGVAQDSDSIYYWTVNGEWLLDGSGNKLRVTGKDGTNGTNGTNGENGQNGTDGTNGANGITPILKIESDYWYVSYDGGTSWNQLGKAKGENGQDGQNGQNGDNIFESVTQDDNYVYFTLTNGTVITIEKQSSTSTNVDPEIPEGVINSIFSVSSTAKVHFSKGNLQYYSIYETLGAHLCADETYKPGVWRFADKQWYSKYAMTDFSGNPTIYNVASIEKDLFSWGESGYQNDNLQLTSDINQTYYDWGVYNAIQNGGNQPNMWRTMTKDEWNYLLFERTNADKLNKWIVINDSIFGLLLLPDNFNVKTTLPSSYYTEDQLFANPKWEILENLGAVFIPATIRGGDYPNISVTQDGSIAMYFFASSTYYSQKKAYAVMAASNASGIVTMFDSNKLVCTILQRVTGALFSVRLVQDVTE